MSGRDHGRYILIADLDEIPLSVDDAVMGLLAPPEVTRAMAWSSEPASESAYSA